MKTIKQIAEEIGVDKQKVYRFVKNNGIKEVHHEALHDVLQKNSVKYYDEVAENLIKQGFKETSESNEVHHEVLREAHQNCINEALYEALLKQLEAMRNELEEKNKQLNEKDKQIEQILQLLDQSQRLQAVAESNIKQLESKLEVSEQETEKKSFRRWWKR